LNILLLCVFVFKKYFYINFTLKYLNCNALKDSIGKNASMHNLSI